MNLYNTLPRSLACLVLPQIFREVQSNVTDAFDRRQKHRDDERGALLATGTRLDTLWCSCEALAAFGHSATQSAIE